jgi:hypothetical protein
VVGPRASMRRPHRAFSVALAVPDLGSTTVACRGDRAAHDAVRRRWKLAAEVAPRCRLACR